MGATAVTKDLVILLDKGNSMGGALPGDILISRDVTKFNAAVNIVKDHLDALTYGDRVSVLSFSRKRDLVYKTVSVLRLNKQAQGFTYLVFVVIDVCCFFLSCILSSDGKRCGLNKIKLYCR